MRAVRRLVLALAPVAGLALSAGTAAAAPLACGQTVARSVRLTTDLGPCSADGLHVGADGVTIDLAGHTITGADDSVAVGIDTGAHRRVVVRDGTLSRFGTLILGGQPGPGSAYTGDRITGLRFRDAETAVSLLGDGNLVAHDVSALRTPPGLAGGDYGLAGRDLRVHDVTAWSNFLSAIGPGARIEGNRAGFLGSNAEDDRPPLVAHNRVSELHIGGDGTHARAFSIVVRDNLLAPPPPQATINLGGIEVDGARHALVAHNRVAGDGIFPLYGIQVYGSDRQPEFDTLASNVITNVNRAFLSAGIIVIGPQRVPFPPYPWLPGAEHERLVDNVTNGGAAGIVNTSTTTALRGNRADDNVGLGIDAIDGTIDLGRNRARGNGDPRQCVGVTCAP